MSVLKKKIIFIKLVAIFAIMFIAPSSYAKDLNNKKNLHDHSSFHIAINKILPREKIDVEFVKGSIVLTGHVSSVEAAEKVEKIAKEYFGYNIKLLNFLKVKGSQQVMLRVRVGEIKRNILKNELNSTYSFANLEQQGLIKNLAEPNLVAMSGERAEFLAGGEFPVPTAQKEGNITVDYKTYGVKVGFTPLVISPNRIRLNIEQELSEISHEDVVIVSGFKIPAILSRKAKTTVELAPGESFMIAGLVKEDFKAGKSKETELVISVTPYLVDPMHSKDLRLPTDNVHIPSILERNFVNKLSKDSPGKNKLTGPVGFIAE